MDDCELGLVGARGGGFAALGPAQAAAHGVGDDFAIVRQRDDVVEDHCDVAAELFLNRDRTFGRDFDEGAIDVRTKTNAGFVERHAVGEAEDLEAAAIGEDGAVPAHEFVEAAECGYGLLAGAEGEMVRVGEDHLCTGFGEAAGVDAFHRAERADGHEGGSFDDAVRRGEFAEAGGGVSVLFEELEGEVRGGHALWR